MKKSEVKKMKFKIDKSLFLDGLLKISKTIAKNTQIPITTGICVKTIEEGIQLTSTNNERSTKVTIPPTEDTVIERYGGSVLPSTLIDVVKKLSGDINIETGENFNTTIVSGRSKIELHGLDPEEFPQIMNVSGECFTLNGEAFKEVVRKTAYAASVNEARPILQGVFMQVNQNTLSSVCTDSHRLAQTSVECHADECNISVPVPAIALKDISSIVNSEQDVSITANQQQFAVQQGNVTFIVRILDGTYPDVSRIIPKESRSRLRLNRNELKNCLEQLMILDKDKPTIRMKVDGMNVLLSTIKSDHGFATSQLFYSDSEGQIEEIDLTFNGRYLFEAVRVMDGDLIDLFFHESERPFLIKPTDKENELSLILPVKILGR